MTIQPFITSNDADNVYLYGNQRLNARDGYAGIEKTPDDYYDAVEKYANQTYNMVVMDNALANGWINQTEYNETLAYGAMKATATATTAPTGV